MSRFLTEEVQIVLTILALENGQISRWILRHDDPRYPDTLYSIYLKQPKGRRWVADCVDIQIANHLAGVLSLVYRVPVSNQTEM